MGDVDASTSTASSPPTGDGLPESMAELLPLLSPVKKNLSESPESPPSPPKHVPHLKRMPHVLVSGHIQPPSTDDMDLTAALGAPPHDDSFASRFPPPPKFFGNSVGASADPGSLGAGGAASYGTTIFGRRSGQSSLTTANNSLAGVLILFFVLIGIVLLLVLFYFLAKVCNAIDQPKGKRRRVRRFEDQEIEVVPSAVPYPKRIYELKAEEGYFSCPPALQPNFADLFEDDDVTPGGGVASLGKHNQQQSSSLPDVSSTGQLKPSDDDDDTSSTKSGPSACRDVEKGVSDDGTLSKTGSSSSAPTLNNTMCPDGFVRKITTAEPPSGFRVKGRLAQLQNGMT